VLSLDDTWYYRLYAYTLSVLSYCAVILNNEHHVTQGLVLVVCLLLLLL